ncbi:hypothetical protein [Agromyces binzhouensis]|uniref:Uncharacterized protein n=1 Tax=Agromyces binzhouensis TaxID=1817495 RepID=A0A4V1QTH0_9MICO|nr:hypothetical protein [Agromyces binzhouensis]RXZ51863.1 hypothetical protein ESO86_00490 [Agromyces binzhouensis]
MAGLAALASWLLAVLINVGIAGNAIFEMGHFERTAEANKRIIAATPWAWASTIGFVALAAIGWWMGSYWWEALLVASAGLIGIQQLIFEPDSWLALPFLLVTVAGAIATVITARPFPRQAPEFAPAADTPDPRHH